VPLETLDAQLAAHAEALRARLVEVVNDDYDEFVSLSTKLVDVDGAVAKLQAPLLEIKERVEAARAAVAAQATALQEGLARRQAAAAARALLELAQEAMHVMAKVEKLLSELPHVGAVGSNVTIGSATAGQDSPGSTLAESEQEDLEARCRLLDRLCSEVSRLNFFVVKGEELAAVRQMAPRIQRAATSLQCELDSALARVIHAQNPTALAVLLHAYGSLGSTDAAESVVRKEVVAPVVAAAVKQTVQKHKEENNSSPSSAVSLAQVLPAVHAALQEKTAPFFELALSPAGGAAAFDFLGGSLLPEAMAAVEKACPGCYSPGLPDAFHANDLAYNLFIDNLERLCVTESQLERFRESESYAKYHKKWNVAAYFSLRFQDVARGLEEALDGIGLTEEKTVEAADSTAEIKFKLSATTAVWHALQSIIDPEVFLPQLSDRFLRLALQVISRFCTWVAEGTKKPEIDNNGAENSSEVAAGAAAAKEEKINNTPWAVGASVEQLAAAAQDITALQSAVQSEILPQFMKLVVSDSITSNSASEALGAAFGDCDDKLGVASDAVLRAAACGLVERCCEALKQLRGIVATFRMTSRGAPTRPAQYASAILEPLSTFLTTADGLSTTGRTALSRAVLEGVVERYHHLAHDTLSTVRKTESSLRRLKSRKGDAIDSSGAGGGATGAAVSTYGTDELIAMQLTLDIEEFGKKVKECGVAPETLDSFKQLKAVVVQPQQES
jgi:conserved oligomeric Golgi complex subunit 2